MGYGSLAQAWVGGDASSPAPPIKTTGSGIEVVITGLTRNRGHFQVALLAETLDFVGFFGYP